jgi:hypothetical protein
MKDVLEAEEQSGVERAQDSEPEPPRQQQPDADEPMPIEELSGTQTEKVVEPAPRPDVGVDEPMLVGEPDPQPEPRDDEPVIRPTAVVTPRPGPDEVVPVSANPDAQVPADLGIDPRPALADANRPITDEVVSGRSPVVEVAHKPIADEVVSGRSPVVGVAHNVRELGSIQSSTTLVDPVPDAIDDEVLDAIDDDDADGESDPDVDMDAANL